MPHLLAAWVTLSFSMRQKAKPHGLPSPLIISLTSYPARFGKLHLTLKCLLSQSIAAEKVILWIAHQDKAALTPAIMNLQKVRLEIAYCDDLKSYKKIIPTLQNHPDSFIVTADDDLYYWPTWLQELVESYNGNLKEVVCHRAHRIQLGKDGLALPYSQWDHEIESSPVSTLIFPTSGGGVLYMPNIFKNEVTNAKVFQDICPNADDVWLYWMMRLNSISARKVGVITSLVNWPTTQRFALWQDNVDCGGNDKQFFAVAARYDLKQHNKQRHSMLTS